MDHRDALREMAVEKYLLGELSGESRDIFEEHLFECQLCAADLTSGVMLLEGARVELAQARPAIVPVRQKKSFLPQWFLNPVWMAPALATCLVVIAYQSFFVVPGMKKEIAEANAPAVLNSVVLAGGTSRGGAERKVSAPENGSFLLSVDIPALADYSSYLCTLSSPSGAVVWSLTVSPEQAKDSVPIIVRATVTQPGENTLVVQGVRPAGGPMDVLSTRKFILEVHE
jgi:Putative zinc-finger